jgi:hypothetical protein
VSLCRAALRDLVHGVDAITAFDSVLVTLMHGVHGHAAKSCQLCDIAPA